MANTPLKIFICYAREDRPALEALMGHLAVFERNGAVQFWYDREITGGKNWDDEIRTNLKTADVVLLLISPDFFRSDYIHTVELTESLQRDRDREALVVPVILKKCFWHKYAELARLQALPAEAKPVFDRQHWPEPDDGFYDIAEGFDRLLDDPDTEARRQRKQQRAQQAAAAAEQKRREEEAAREKQKLADQKKREAAARAAEQKRREEEEARKKALEPEMVLVKGGSFKLGGTHPVTLSDFQIGKYPVTQKLWQEIMGANPADFKGDDLPVECVSWDDAQQFLKKLNTRFPGKNYRLPSEAEWEYAARGGAGSNGFEYAGSDDLDEVGWYYGNSNNKTHPVGQKNPNELGLYDMSGNVWEWCEDDWHDNVNNGPKDGSAWVYQRKRGAYRVYRGGSWNDDAGYCRVSYRTYWYPDYRYYFLGFRLASFPQ
ncbi:MAG: SUMF1/EgtB/PvdO family nonheme iron enzyme [Saprospiraceae bacterium]